MQPAHRGCKTKPEQALTVVTQDFAESLRARIIPLPPNRNEPES